LDGGVGCVVGELHAHGAGLAGGEVGRGGEGEGREEGGEEECSLHLRWWGVDLWEGWGWKELVKTVCASCEDSGDDIADEKRREEAMLSALYIFLPYGCVHSCVFS
jgi:hypothetical protein